MTKTSQIHKILLNAYGPIFTCGSWTINEGRQTRCSPEWLQLSFRKWERRQYASMMCRHFTDTQQVFVDEEHLKLQFIYDSVSKWEDTDLRFLVGVCALWWHCQWRVRNWVRATSGITLRSRREFVGTIMNNWKQLGVCTCKWAAEFIWNNRRLALNCFGFFLSFNIGVERWNAVMLFFHSKSLEISLEMISSWFDCGG